MRRDTTYPRAKFGTENFVIVPIYFSVKISRAKRRVVALDPGIRSFLTIYSESVCGWVGRGDFGRIQRLCAHLDDVLGQIAKAKGKRRQRLRKAAARARNRIKNLIDELHHKTARFLVDNFDIILLPTFETKDMVKRGKRKIRSKTASLAREILTLSE